MRPAIRKLLGILGFAVCGVAIVLMTEKRIPVGFIIRVKRKPGKLLCKLPELNG